MRLGYFLSCLFRINGFQMATGGLDVLAAFTPVEFALRFTDWRGVFLDLGVLCVLMAAAVFTVVPESDKNRCLSLQILGLAWFFISPLLQNRS